MMLLLLLCCCRRLLLFPDMQGDYLHYHRQCVLTNFRWIDREQFVRCDYFLSPITDGTIGLFTVIVFAKVLTSSQIHTAHHHHHSLHQQHFINKT
mmetsp:Transcript_3588/g.2998  ORF Transcript_3588/g.2998 Transcript_3588/m.2998 type:complete len:95 (-) Transcript_3588:677-961(-)